MQYLNTLVLSTIAITSSLASDIPKRFREPIRELSKICAKEVPSGCGVRKKRSYIPIHVDLDAFSHTGKLVSRRAYEHFKKRGPTQLAYYERQMKSSAPKEFSRDDLSKLEWSELFEKGLESEQMNVIIDKILTTYTSKVTHLAQVNELMYSMSDGSDDTYPGPLQSYFGIEPWSDDVIVSKTMKELIRIAPQECALACADQKKHEEAIYYLPQTKPCPANTQPVYTYDLSEVRVCANLTRLAESMPEKELRYAADSVASYIRLVLNPGPTGIPSADQRRQLETDTEQLWGQLKTVRQATPHLDAVTRGSSGFFRHLR